LTISYSGGDLADAAGVALAAFGPSAVANNIPAPVTLTVTRLPGTDTDGFYYVAPAAGLTKTFPIAVNLADYAAGDTLFIEIGGANCNNITSAKFNDNPTATPTIYDGGGSTRRAATITYTLQAGDIGTTTTVDLVVTFSAGTSAPYFAQAHMIEGSHAINTEVAYNTTAQPNISDVITPADLNTNKILAFHFGGADFIGSETWAGVTAIGNSGTDDSSRAVASAQASNVSGSTTVTLTYNTADSAGVLLTTAITPV